ncbi:hypothetical protein PHYPSEUDO_011926 [Phytophthora pseudosyringae]|uniref:Uncharacterized protein n=1 Tax=Phytophthora pseudosyringae TaxID=221518 RepID=A0A8T1W9E5_9STRA|nr:hypothetical protein PHYPSEUDO_011926 [Phytophthora pseudosyringae]
MDLTSGAPDASRQPHEVLHPPPPSPPPQDSLESMTELDRQMFGSGDDDEGSPRNSASTDSSPKSEGLSLGYSSHSEESLGTPAGSLQSLTAMDMVTERSSGVLSHDHLPDPSRDITPEGLQSEPAPDSPENDAELGEASVEVPIADTYDGDNETRGNEDSDVVDSGETSSAPQISDAFGPAGHGSGPGEHDDDEPLFDFSGGSILADEDVPPSNEGSDDSEGEIGSLG